MLTTIRPKSEPLDEAALIEQRRKRREAILAKHRSGPNPLMVQALQLSDKSAPDTPMRSEGDGDDGHSTANGKHRILVDLDRR